MFMLTLKFNKKTAVFIVVMAALVLIGIVLLAGARHAAAERAAQTDAQTDAPVTAVKNEQSRCRYLEQYGWEVESPALSSETVVIPRSFSDVFDAYNELQKQQGFDLSEYCGLEAELYTYRVKNYENDPNVVARLYVRNGSVIGGDVHSTQLDGFMTGIK